MLKLAVTTLAEFVHRRGDLHARLDARTRPEEGVAAQRALQRGRPATYQRERAVALTVTPAGEPVRLGGRIDGCDVSGDELLVEEFKTTRADPERAHAHGASVHWAQARLYAGLLVAELGEQRQVRVRLCYVHPDSLSARTYERVESAASLRDFLDRSLADYGAWLEGQGHHQRRRDEALSAGQFPFADYRPFQRAMARRVYRALRDREHLLLEAPTGSGKTMATLYPALHALKNAGYRRVFFLTSRSTGAIAARTAAQRVDPDAAYLRHVTVVARDKACFVPGTPCEPDACPYARGYYDRRRAALSELLAHGAAVPETVGAVARQHQVCPFELSLDAARWSDLVIADYNYLFDPLVRLHRFDADPQAALLIDESHQLAPRVRDMLSLTFDRAQVREALREGAPQPLARRIRSLDRCLTDLRRDRALAEEREIARPEALLRSMQRFADSVTATDLPLEPWPATQALWFTCCRWLRSDGWFDPERFVYLGEAARRDIALRLVCVDPAPYLRTRLDAYGGHVRFSGTVSPLPLYGMLHGEAEAPAERAGNPYRPDQLRVLLVPDVPTFLQRRAASVGRLADLIDAVVSAHRGNYLVAFPSFAYLELCADALALSHPQLPVWRQTPAMDEPARADFLERFNDAAQAAVGFVVLGGAFGESVDFAGASLAGVICVGVGLPPPSLARRAMERHFSARGEDGHAVAFRQPAMVKVLQMAGRLLRGPDDRGVLCLVDPRFAEAGYRGFFPDHWQPRTVPAAQAGAEMAAFWEGQRRGASQCAGGLTKLRGFHRGS